MTSTALEGASFAPPLRRCRHGIPFPFLLFLPVARRRGGIRHDAVCRAHAGPCGVTITETFHSLPADFDANVISALRKAADLVGVRTLDIASGALHDAKFLQDVCPSGMIFVPCEKGISHNEAENAKPEDLASGARVLAEALVILAND